jgi:DNA-binding CsgD family transcriptional regulator
LVDPPSAVLSGRELQVARLLLRNQTYREIGERLFISPKTVEHHVARMKQRIGASRRSELFSQLRELTNGPDA